jgi:RNA polymerase sigma-70 factor (ECF subfamily)
MYNKKNNEELAKEAITDPEAFGELYDRYYDKLLMYIFRRVLDAKLAEDILSNTFYKALNKVETFNPEIASFSTWIYRIATNEINMYFRKKGKYVVGLDSEMMEYFVKEKQGHAEDAEEILSRHQDFQILAKAIRELKPIYQDILHLRYFEDFSHKKISETVKMKESSVRVYLHRALKLLEKQLKNDANKFLTESYGK